MKPAATKVKIDGKEYKIKDLQKRLGIGRLSVQRKFRKYEAGTISAEQMLTPHKETMFSVEVEGERWTAPMVARKAKITSAGAIYRMRQYKRGKMSVKTLFSTENVSGAWTVFSDGEHSYTALDIMDIARCSHDHALHRLKWWRSGKITHAELVSSEPINHDRRSPASEWAALGNKVRNQHLLSKKIPTDLDREMSKHSTADFHSAVSTATAGIVGNGLY